MESTPDRFLPDFCRCAQSSGECPGDKSTFPPRAFGVFLTVGSALGGRPKLPFEVGGPRFGSGPRLGRGPVVGTRIDGEGEVGRARRFEAATRGGGMSEVAGLGGGAMRVGLLDGGGMTENEGALEARCAEFMAGKEGGGRSSSSSSSELSCSLSVNVGTEDALSSGTGIAFGVDSRDRLMGAPLLLSSCFTRGDCSSMLCSSAGASSCFWPCCDCSATARDGACVTRAMKASHVDGGRW